MNKIDAMHAFVRVAELSSFTLAAQSLGISKANISGVIQSLEEWLGTRLFHRTTRKVHMTEVMSVAKIFLLIWKSWRLFFNKAQNR